MLNVNVSYAFVLASLQLLHDLEAVQTHATHTESGYYIYVDNELGQDVVFEVVFDGGFGSQVKKIRKDWEAVEQKEKTLLKRGLLLMSSTQPSQQSSSQQSSSQQSLSQQSPSQLVCVELYSVEPFLRVTSASADGAVSTSVEGSIQWCEDALGVFACSLDTPEGRVPAFFSACDENSASAWRALPSPFSAVSAAAPCRGDAARAGARTRRSSLPDIRRASAAQRGVVQPTHRVAEHPRVRGDRVLLRRGGGAAVQRALARMARTATTCW